MGKPAHPSRTGRYEITCTRTWLKMFDLLLKARSAAEELDCDTIASIERVAPARDTRENFTWRRPLQSSRKCQARRSKWTRRIRLLR